MMPVLQTFISIPAGIARMPRLRFHIYTSLGSIIWYTCLAWAGMKLGEKWQTDPRLEQIFHRFHLVVEIAIVVAIVWFVWSHVNRAKQGSAASGSAGSEQGGAVR
jgi:membrane protein DedA with SNARE-associated domain